MTDMTWEYTTIMLAATGFLGGEVDGDALTGKLNDLGAQGWELVSMVDTNMMRGRTKEIVAVLKRPRSS